MDDLFPSGPSIHISVAGCNVVWSAALLFNRLSDFYFTIMDSPAARGLSDRLVIAGSVFLAGTTLYLIAISIYRLYFHPLAKFPGPVANAISWVRGRTNLGL